MANYDQKCKHTYNMYWQLLIIKKIEKTHRKQWKGWGRVSFFSHVVDEWWQWHIVLFFQLQTIVNWFDTGITGADDNVVVLFLAPLPTDCYRQLK